MLRFLDIEKFTKNLRPVTSVIIFSSEGVFDKSGLFSETIFGPVGSLERRKVYSYIDLKTKIIHPTAYKILMRLNRKIHKLISGESTFRFSSDNKLIEDPNGNIIGLSRFIEIFPEIRFEGGTSVREKLVRLLSDANRKGLLFVSKVIVIPPEFRPIFQDQKGNWVKDAINDSYLSILRKTLQAVPEAGPVKDVFSFNIQKAVNDHDDFVRAKISKKKGLIRSQILGKRVDYSGRAVVTPDPSLKVGEIGLPFRLAVKLFEPFIVHILLFAGRPTEKLSNQVKDFLDLELSPESLMKVINSIRNDDKVPQPLFDIIWEATEVAMANRTVLAKRDPVLHAESVRAFKPILVKGNSIRICTLQVGGFNADFDGDQMAVYHPLTNESQKETKEKLMRSQGNQSFTSLNYELSKEMYVGIYLITKSNQPEGAFRAITKQELQNITNPLIAVRYKGTNTTAGRAIFNSCLPDSYPFINQVIKKKEVKNILFDISTKYPPEVVEEVAVCLERAGFKFATIMAPSLSLDELVIPEEVKKLKNQLKNASPEQADAILKDIESVMKEYTKDTGLYDLVESGAGKGWEQPRQIIGSKGLVADSEGNTLPTISSSLSEGLKPTEYFNMSYGSRYGIINRVINTADTGYFARILAFVLNDVEHHKTLYDCKTTMTLPLKLTSDFIKRVRGRFIVDKGKIRELEQEELKPGSIINLRTPIYCITPKICYLCYGRFIEKLRSPYIGLIAAQVIGEPGTQMIMKAFHTGGSVSFQKRDMIVDISQNDPSIKPGFLTKYLRQEGRSLFLEQDCNATISLDLYELGKNIRFDESKVWVKSAVIDLEFSDVEFSVILDYPVDISYTQMQRSVDYVKIPYTSGDLFISASLESGDIQKQILYVQRLLAGREIVRDPQHLLTRFYKIYSSLSDMDLVHMEVLMSQVLRSRKQPAKPARIVQPYEPVLANIKETIFAKSYVQGIAFENIGKSILMGLIQEEYTSPSILEDVLSGNISGRK